MPQFIADQIRINHNPGEQKPRDRSVQPAVARVNHPWTTEAIRLLDVAFPWDQTLEGEAFWFDIVKRLQRIKDRGR
ncbi:MAG: hypothetical protein JWL84_4497 [Rhodospirillales bacterium]|nr:hypothetical protein [Rhodospirillales bacterium]